MIKHEIRYYSQDDPTTLRLGYAVYCNKCRSRVFTWLKVSEIRADKRIAERIFDKLKKEWEKDVLEDCEEAKCLNLIKEIHEED